MTLHPHKALFKLSQSLTLRDKQLLIWCLDLTLVPASFLLTCSVTYGAVWPKAELQRLDILLPILAFLAGCFSLGFGLTQIKLKTYQSFGALALFPYAAALGLSLLGLSQLPQLAFPLIGTLGFTLVVFLAAIGGRLLLLQIYLLALRYDKVPVRALIYGAGSTGLRLASALKAHETIKLVAFLDDDARLHCHRLAGRRILPPDQLPEILRRWKITRIILAMPSLSAPNHQRLRRQLQALDVEVQSVPSFDSLVGVDPLFDPLQAINPMAFLNRARLDHSLPTGADSYRDRVVMVTGAGGSVGAELCRQLIRHAPRKIVLFEMSEPALYSLERELRAAMQGATPILVAILGSLTDARLTRHVLTAHRVEVVLHAAAYKHVALVEANPLAGLINNVFGTRTLADACVAAGVARVILVSTDKAVRPTSVMGASKRLAELVLQDLARHHPATQFSIVRFGNVLGSSGSVIPLFRAQIAQGGPITLTDAAVTRYFMTVTEAAQLVLLAGSFRDKASHARAHVYVLDMGKPVSICSLAEQMIAAAGYSLRDASHPTGDIEIKIIGLRQGEKLHEELLFGDGLLTTPHPKILRAPEEPAQGVDISRLLQELARFAALGDAKAARAWALEAAQENVAPAAERLQPARL